MSDEQKPPPNPFYVRHYVWSMRSGGHACFDIPAPGGKFNAGDAPGLIGFMQMIIEQLNDAITEPPK